MTKGSVFDFVSKHWAMLSGLAIAGVVGYVTLQLHSKDIENLKAADLEIRSEIKSLREEMASSSKEVANSLQDIRLQLREINTTLKVQKELQQRGSK